MTRLCILGVVWVSAGLVSCASRQPVQEGEVSMKKTNWYVAAREPLTFCPRGYELPVSKWVATTGVYVYLADRKTRFYIPAGPDHMRYRAEAMKVREASLTPEFKRQQQTENAVFWVSKTLLRLALTTAVLALSGPGGADDPAYAIESIWGN